MVFIIMAALVMIHHHSYDHYHSYDDGYCSGYDENDRGYDEDDSICLKVMGIQ